MVALHETVCEVHVLSMSVLRFMADILVWTTWWTERHPNSHAASIAKTYSKA